MSGQQPSIDNLIQILRYSLEDLAQGFNQSQTQDLCERVRNIQGMLLQFTPQQKQQIQYQNAIKVKELEGKIQNLGQQLKRLKSSPNEQQIMTLQLTNYSQTFDFASQLIDQIIQDIDTLLTSVQGQQKAKQFQQQNEALKSNVQIVRLQLEQLNSKIITTTQQLHQNMKNSYSNEEDQQRLVQELEVLCGKQQNELQQIIKDRSNELILNFLEKSKQQLEEQYRNLSESQIQMQMDQWVTDQFARKFYQQNPQLKGKFTLNIEVFCDKLIQFFQQNNISQNISSYRDGFLNALKEILNVVKSDLVNQSEINNFFAFQVSDQEERIKLINLSKIYQERYQSAHNFNGVLTLQINTILDKENMTPEQRYPLGVK